METLIKEWKKFKAEEIFNRFNPNKPYPKDIILTMIMSAIDMGYKSSINYKELQKSIEHLILELQELKSTEKI